MSPSLQQLKNRRLVWQARESQSGNSQSMLSSGYTLLDDKLSGGWPRCGVVELNIDRIGSGELRLILPALKALQNGDTKTQLQAWVNPPARLNPLALSHQDIELNHTLVATPRDLKESYWVVEQLLRSACCSSVVFWADQLEPRQAKRLQLTAKQSGCLLFVIRQNQEKTVQQSLPLSLRINLAYEQNGLRIDVFKRQNQWPIEPFILDMQSQWPQLYQAKNNAQNEVESPINKTVIAYPFGTSQPCKH